MDSDDVVVAFITILLVVAVIFGSFALTNWSRDNTDADCKQRYGQSWVGKYDYYGPNFCVNTDGSVKYLQ